VKKISRGYVDGAFDLVHSGHFNAIRQAYALCDELVVGANSDEDITEVKGPPIFDINERSYILRACKWASQVVPGTPYTVSEKLLDDLKCDFYIHGDDPCYDAEGVELCSYFEERGKFKVIQRTAGVSTTNITGKLLKLAKIINNELSEDDLDSP
jgi:ethanolamine-phosphate cytidylyltransferase